MPRYFFHQGIGDETIWDRVGLELPDFGLAPGEGSVAPRWEDAIAGQLQPGRILVITDAIGQVLFVTAG